MDVTVSWNGTYPEVLRNVHNSWVNQKLVFISRLKSEGVLGISALSL